ncbi:MAG TPA: hypothetical protein VIV07_07000, partial [Sphingomicrobium sp.]
AGAALASATIATPPASKLVIAFMAVTPSTIATRRFERTATQSVTYRYGIAPLLNRALAAIQLNSSKT